MMNPHARKWTLRGGYPAAWFLLSSTMLTSQFVGVQCGSHWNNVFAPGAHVQALGCAQDWLLPAHREPPDPIRRIVTMHTEHVDDDDDHNAYLVNNFIYEVRNSLRRPKRGALVDRGANGGLAGADVRQLHQHPSRKVDIQGIDNHRLPGIPIVTAAAVVQSQKGPLVLIMNQCAGIGKGQTIHSSAQLESHGVTVDDRAVKNGGKQRIIVQGGHVIPLQIRTGLPYMDMRPPTDAELFGPDCLPQAILTSDLDWDPQCLDHEHEASAWDDVASHELELGYDAPFRDDGEYVHTHPLAVTSAELLADPTLTSDIINDPREHLERVIHNHTVTPAQPDYESYRPKFGWLPKDTIRQTFEQTTQFYRRPLANLRKHFKTPYPACNVFRRNEPLATDTVYSDVPAIDDGSQTAQVFVGTESLVSDVYGMKTEKQFVNTLQDIIRQRGAPTKLISDSAQVEISGKVKDILRYLFIEDWQSEPHHQNQNPAERRYQDLKRVTNRLLDRTGSPPELWLLALKYAAYLLNHVATDSLQGRVPLAVLNGTPPDISSLLRFQWYERVYYRQEEDTFPSSSTEKLGYFVGFTPNVGHALTFAILTADAHKVISRSEVRSAADSSTANLRANDWGDSADDSGETADHSQGIVHGRLDGNGEPLPMTIIDVDDLIGKTFKLPDDNGILQPATVIEAIHDHQSHVKEASAHTKFRVQRNSDKYEEILACDQLMDHIERDTDVFWDLDRIVAHQGPLRQSDPCYKGSKWNVTVLWKNGEKSDEPLTIIGADSPVSCAIYADKHGLLDQPGWRRFKPIARSQKKLIFESNKAKLRSQYFKPKFKYGIEVPRSYGHAKRIDGNDPEQRNLWQLAVDKEMECLHKHGVFKDLGKDTPIPNGHKKIRVHLVFDVKHDGRHRARMVADGHLTDVPVDSCYSSVVSLRGFRLLIFIAELNGLKTWSVDISSAYLEAKTKEKIAIIAGPEFGPLEGHTLIVYKALYGLRTSGVRWHDRFAECMRAEGFFPCLAEQDIWMRPNGNIYEYVAVYVDDLAFAVRDPQRFLKILEEKHKFHLKGMGEISYHLGADFVRDSDGVLCMKPRKYIEKRLVLSYEKMFGEKPGGKAMSPLESNSHPELDDSELLDEEGIQRYQSVMGSLQWCVSLGRFDIACAVMTLSAFRSAPRRGHLAQAQRICKYLCRTKNFCTRFRTAEPDLSHLTQPSQDWFQICGNVQELLPSNAPPPLGRHVQLSHFVDANLFHDALTGRSVTACLHFANGTPVDYFSKKQATVETATYGSEFVAARTCVEQIIDLRNTFRYLNESVVNSATQLHAKLHKRHNALSFHRVREAIASGYIMFHFCPGSENPADVLSKHWGYQAVKDQLLALLHQPGSTEFDDPS
jgi:hypothetical protein